MAGHVHGDVGSEGAGEDADQRDPAQIGVGGGLHDLGGQRCIGSAGQGRRRRAVGQRDRRAAVLRGAGEPGDQELEQIVDTYPQEGRGAEHGVEVAAGHRGLQVGDEVGLHELVTGQVPLHEGLVLALADDALDELRAEPVGLALPRRPGPGVRSEQVDQPADGAVGVALDQVHRIDAVPQQQLAEPDGVLGVGPGTVELGDDDGPRQTDRRALLPQLHGGGADPVDR
jgi:hypothetical protein